MTKSTMRISFQQKLIVFISILIVTMGFKHCAAEQNPLFVQAIEEAEGLGQPSLLIPICDCWVRTSQARVLNTNPIHG